MRNTIQAILWAAILLTHASMAQASPELPAINPANLIQRSEIEGGQAISLKPSLQASEQLMGNYTDIGRDNLPLGMIQEAWKKGGETAGVYTVVHRENHVIRIVSRENTKSLIQLPTYETVKKIVVGNEAILSVEQIARNRLILTPKHFVGVDTNLMVIGESGLVYNFYIQVHGYNSKTIPDLKVIVWTPHRPIKQHLTHGESDDAPQKEKNSLLEKRTPIAIGPQGDFLEKVPFSPENLNYFFAMAGDKTIAPKRVFTDGWRTFFDFGNNMGRQEIPFVFRVVDGIDTEVNVIRKGNLLMATETGTFALRLGKQRVCVWPTRG